MDKKAFVFRAVVLPVIELLIELKGRTADMHQRTKPQLCV